MAYRSQPLLPPGSPARAFPRGGGWCSFPTAAGTLVLVTVLLATASWARQQERAPQQVRGASNARAAVSEPPSSEPPSAGNAAPSAGNPRTVHTVEEYRASVEESNAQLRPLLGRPEDSMTREEQKAAMGLLKFNLRFSNTLVTGEPDWQRKWPPADGKARRAAGAEACPGPAAGDASGWLFRAAGLGPGGGDGAGLHAFISRVGFRYGAEGKRALWRNLLLGLRATARASVEHQTCRELVWILYTEAALGEARLRELREAVGPDPRFLVVPLEQSDAGEESPLAQTLPEQLRLALPALEGEQRAAAQAIVDRGLDVSLSTWLDVDDALHVETAKAMQVQALSPHPRGAGEDEDAYYACWNDGPLMWYYSERDLGFAEEFLFVNFQMKFRTCFATGVTLFKFGGGQGAPRSVYGDIDHFQVEYQPGTVLMQADWDLGAGGDGSVAPHAWAPSSYAMFRSRTPMSHSMADLKPFMLTGIPQIVEQEDWIYGRPEVAPAEALAMFGMDEESLRAWNAELYASEADIAYEHLEQAVGFLDVDERWTSDWISNPLVDGRNGAGEGKMAMSVDKWLCLLDKHGHEYPPAFARYYEDQVAQDTPWSHKQLHCGHD